MVQSKKPYLHTVCASFPEEDSEGDKPFLKSRAPWHRREARAVLGRERVERD